MDKKQVEAVYHYLYSLCKSEYQIIVTYNSSFHLLKVVSVYLRLCDNFKTQGNCFEHSSVLSTFIKYRLDLTVPQGNLRI